MRWGVVGLGAVGGLYASRLWRAGAELHHLVRRDAAHIRRHGLHVTSPLGDVHDPAPAVYDDPAAMPRCDAVLVALKTTANDALPAILPRVLRPGGTVLMLQNGLEVEAAAARAAADATILGGLCFVCAHKRAPGVIDHIDYGAVLLGEWRADGSKAGVTDACEHVATQLRAGGVDTDIAADLIAARWAKLCWNIPYNGLSVLYRTDTAGLMRTPAWRAEVETLMHEVADAAAACGRPLPEGHLATMLGNTARMVPYLPSMRRDHDAGRPLEIEAIYGRPLRAAEAAGAAVPGIRSVYQRLCALASTG